MPVKRQAEQCAEYWQNSAEYLQNSAEYLQKSAEFRIIRDIRNILTIPNTSNYSELFR